MFYRKQITKITVFIVLALFFAFGTAFAETVDEAYDKAVAYAKQGNYDQAISDCNRAIELIPS